MPPAGSGPSTRTIARIFFTVVALAAGLYLLYLVRSVVGLVAIALFLAIALGPAVDIFDRRGLNRGLSILVVYALLFFAVVGVGLLVVPAWRYRVHRWEVSPTAVYTQRGWVNQERRIAPISRVQTVDTSRGPLQQAAGIAALVVTTASAKGALVVHGLDPERAEQLSDELARRAQLVGGDGT